MMPYKTRPHNTPVVTLIRNYVDKKSGKVADSRKEIQRRFDHLDWKDQKKILLAFLDSGKTDRQWAYMKLLDYWDKSFEPKVRALWESLREPQCSWSVIRFFPLDYVVDHIDTFKGHRDYYFICRRLIERPGYDIDRSRLSAIDYLSLLYHAGREITSDEANGILFEIVHDLCVNGFDVNSVERFGYDAEGIFSPANFRSVVLGKYYLREMNNIQAEWLFDEWNQKVEQAILQSPEYQALLRCDGAPFYYLEHKIAIVRKYAYLYLDAQYKLPTDKGVSAILAPDVLKKLASPDFDPIKRPLFNPTSDSMRLEGMIDDNPALKSLIDTFDLEIKGR